MTNFDKIYEIAVDNYGLISTKQANNEGVTNAELARFVKQGKLTRRNMVHPSCQGCSKKHELGKQDRESHASPGIQYRS